jgi:hypothetical protein
LARLTAASATHLVLGVVARAVPTDGMTRVPSGRLLRLLGMYDVPVWRSYTTYMIVIADHDLYDV